MQTFSTPYDKRPTELARLRAAIADRQAAHRGLHGVIGEVGASPGASPQANPWSYASAGGVHEWFAGADRSHGHPGGRPRTFWLPPMAVLIGLAWEAVNTHPGQRVVWIGQRCWPHPPALAQPSSPGSLRSESRLLACSIFVNTPTSRVGHAERVWAIELASRCSGVAMVIADGSALTMAESRRLQLAARDTPVLLARPPWEQRELSAARTRWRVSPALHTDRTEHTEQHRQGWTVELLRCKGLQTMPKREDARRWAVQRDHATGRIAMEHIPAATDDGTLPAQMVNGPGSTARTRPA